MAVRFVTVTGRVVRQDRGYVTVRVDGGGEVVADERYDRNGTVVVGDRVTVNDDGEVASVDERRGVLRRLDALGRDDQVLAANVDVVLAVAGLDRPVRPGRLHRTIAQAHDAGAEPIVVLNKIDLVDAAEDAIREVAAGQPGVTVLGVSARTGTGVDRLAATIGDRTVVMLGESGAGKSSLLNALLGTDEVVTGAVRSGDAKGRHTTTHRELFELPGGGAVIDTPGVRALGLAAEPEAVDATFPEIEDRAGECRFADCTHRHEPGCAVLAAVGDGGIDQARYDAWAALRDEVEATARQREQRRRRGGGRRRRG